MPSWAAGAAGTFAISAVSAYLFLRLRCRGIGYPLGHRARRWTITIVLLTAALSTGLGLAAASAGGHLRAAYISAIVPSGLWLGQVSANRRRRGDVLPRELIDGLMLPFHRLDGRMGDDMQDWCDVRCAAVAGDSQLISDAAEHYYIQVANQLKHDQERAEVERLRASIMHKAKTAQLAGLATTPARLQAALRAHAGTSDPRKYAAGDPQQLADRLTFEAANELHLLLAYFYRLGYRKLVIHQGFKPAPAADRRGRHTPHSTAQSS
jgi:hypothetical protein